MYLNPRCFQILLHQLRLIIRGVVNDDVNHFRLRVLCLQLVEQTDRRLGVDTVGKVCHRLERVNIDGTIDVHPLTTTIRLQLLLDTAANPTKGRDFKAKRLNE